jgi:Holliday junction resolvasome RuvABC ATP-dependent DNA helicase subunit
MTLDDDLISRDQLSCIQARARLLELALLGAGKSGMSLDDDTYLDALTQQAQDIARGLDQLAETMDKERVAT